MLIFKHQKNILQLKHYKILNNILYLYVKKKLYFISILQLFCNHFIQKNKKYENTIKNLKNLIGHALIYIASCQLQSYFALLYQLITWDQLIENKPPSETDQFLKFKQKLIWPNNTSYFYFIIILRLFYNYFKFIYRKN